MHAKKSTDYLSVETVVNAHGGETMFWLKHLTGDLNDDVRAWIADRRDTDSPVRAWLAVVESSEARTALRRALEAGNYLVDLDIEGHDSSSWTDDELTDMVQQNRDAHDSPPYRERVKSCLFTLLDEIEISLPVQRESELATALLEHLVGLDSVCGFRHQVSWLRRLRRRNLNPPRLDQLLKCLSPELLAKSSGRWRYQLSFRLFVRERFRGFAEEHSLCPSGSRFSDLDSAIDSLTRQRIGELARMASREKELAALQVGWKLAHVEFED
jgi:hypothetical protein